MIDFDFTLTKYRDLCQAIVSSKYTPLTIHEYLTQAYSNNCIIMRHDVDRKPVQALKMARIEHDHGIRSTYYFRNTKEVFKPPIIKQIDELGHEIGYHYEVLDKAKGDAKKAIMIFEQDLEEFRKLVDVTTICMHGNPLTPWLNRDIWKVYKFNNFGIIGEAYLSIDYTRVSYFTDTGRAWNSSKYNIKDIIETRIYNNHVRSTDELIDLIRSGGQRDICTLTHPNRWTDNFGAWLIEHIYQNVKNVGKAMIKYREASHD
ncbi:hypothetical protein ANME2D_01686 [Candidatus Methanoperedens nitroreducens]|uniref:Polysaccharide deacetylase n=1 Tax=Candidatus Methanoperedens nitratireducens TaxID=1392998 RepID=A0A062UZC5_9EURY|nr:hypothetical protein [Candidatus Methanoperedens nitroreducens]KCZ72281.1 hypothetical protein ANME2D_01686 [Candidatus Methanoperedens nitroreducens]MDJ1420746.1 hypothetical protein [Candidatus Methanoperedens sp.]